MFVFLQGKAVSDMKSMTDEKRAVREEIGNRSRHYCSAVMRVYRQKELRKLQLRRRVCVLAVLAAAFFAGGAFAANGLRTEAASEHTAYKYYNSIVVQYGEHFSDIAEKYYDGRYYESLDAYTRELCSINNIGYYRAEESVRPGNRLIVAYYAEEFR